MNYQDFLQNKTTLLQPVGRKISHDEINPVLFPFQRDIVAWAVHKGRCAIFADTGLGKTVMQTEWARLVGGYILILAPLGVTGQTVKEAKTMLGLDIQYVTNQSEVGAAGIYITNYEKIHHFAPDIWHGIVLDESSILKSLSGKTRKSLTEFSESIQYRLCATATPAPNDVTELGQHSEFLGVLKYKEVLATYFVNRQNNPDGNSQGWSMKKHARVPFYRWLASWAIAITKPSDLGYSDEGYNLPPITVTPHFIKTDYIPEGQLFFTQLKGVTDRAKVRKSTLSDRCDYAAGLVNGNSEQWIVWYGLVEEGKTIAAQIEGSALIQGDTSDEKRLEILGDFMSGKTRVLVTNPKIFGFGMNFQHCHNMAFVGLDDSWERYYQSIRRCYRFGQKSPVNVEIVLTDVQTAIFENIQSKEREARSMMQDLVNQVREFEIEELKGMTTQDWQYTQDLYKTENAHLMLGDSCERINEIPDNSLDLTVTSIPFMSLYTYTATERDLGNCADSDTFFTQMQYIIKGLLRATKPGRNVCVHVQQVRTTMQSNGVIGLNDFRGDTIRAFMQAGWIYYGEITIDKNPQVQATRTKHASLLFVQKEKDSAKLAPALADYVIIFKKPGDNVTPINTDSITDEEWISWAHNVWYDIRETDVLNTAVAKSHDDERHICPLQLPLIYRLIRLYSNKGETVFDPFAGIGSTLYEAIKAGRKGMGIELKPEYWKVAVKNIKSAQASQRDLFSWANEHKKTEFSFTE